jgi:transcriptional regulator with GAF, ATPase, and Fis domain
VILSNRAAKELFDIREEPRFLFTHLLHPDYRKTFEFYIQQLEKPAESPPFRWIKGGMILKGNKGTLIHAEGTISKYLANDEKYFSLVLRDVNERIEADHKIQKLMYHKEYLQKELAQNSQPAILYSKSPSMMRVIDQVKRVAGTETNILITGASGTGKEVLARAIHERSSRANESLICVNCGAIPANLVESELFGHEKGAFTGATSKRPGRFSLADGGTLFLDELGELPVELQPKLLRVLQEGTFEPVGSSKTQKVDVRVISATNKDLKRMVSEGSFREDLYYRLNVFPIQLPLLKDRKEDLSDLAQMFVIEICKKNNLTPLRLTENCLKMISSYDWPGNIRELRNVIERAVITAEDGKLNWTYAMPDHPPTSSATSSGTLDQGTQDQRVITITEMRELEKHNIISALEISNGKISGKGGAAQLLGIKPTTLNSRMKALGLERKRS